jgi:hypothetical protein
MFALLLSRGEPTLAGKRRRRSGSSAAAATALLFVSPGQHKAFRPDAGRVRRLAFTGR